MKLIQVEDLHFRLFFQQICCKTVANSAEKIYNNAKKFFYESFENLEEKLEKSLVKYGKLRVL